MKFNMGVLGRVSEARGIEITTIPALESEPFSVKKRLFSFA